MSTRRLVAIVVFSLGLAACGPAVALAPVYPQGGLRSVDPSLVHPLGRVTGEACQGSVFDYPSEDDARNDLRRNATRMGATGVIVMTCEPVSWAQSCKGFRCSAEAFRLDVPR
jgi:hypothetical protein